MSIFDRIPIIEKNTDNFSKYLFFKYKFYEIENIKKFYFFRSLITLHQCLKLVFVEFLMSLKKRVV